MTRQRQIFLALIVVSAALAGSKAAMADVGMSTVVPYGNPFVATIAIRPAAGKPPFLVLSGWRSEMDPSAWERIQILLGVKSDIGHRINTSLEGRALDRAGAIWGKCATYQVRARLAKAYSAKGSALYNGETIWLVSEIRC